MPYSAGENEQDIIDFVKSHDIKRVLDVGAGSGTYGRWLKPHVESVHAIEVWTKYIEEFNLAGVYDKVYPVDARSFFDSNEGGTTWDMVVFGDVLEHMSEDESLSLWGQASKWARYGVISIPIVHYPQGEEFGNPYEVHVQEHVHAEDLRANYGPFVFDKEYDITGMFIKEFGEQ